VNATNALLESLQWAHELLGMVTADLTVEQAQWQPPGIANPAGAMYAHAFLGEDGVLNSILKGGAPLFAGEWAGKTGASEPQMQATPEWARSVQVDLSALREYGKAVAAATEAYIGTLTDDDLERVIDLSNAGLGEQSVSWVISALIVGHLNNMAGEISVLKGLQGARGYPF
jgi:hypothetical protein